MKRLKTLSSRQSPKRQFSRNAFLYFPAILFATLLGTYLDLLFVGKKLYEFPIRPFSEIFSINIAFTLIILPILTGVFLYLCDKMPKWNRLVFILFLSVIVPIIEKMSVKWGFFYPKDQWNHIYSFIGYFLFLVLIWKIFEWGKSNQPVT